jgi:hypothetical protein
MHQDAKAHTFLLSWESWVVEQEQEEPGDNNSTLSFSLEMLACTANISIPFSRLKKYPFKEGVLCLKPRAG